MRIIFWGTPEYSIIASPVKSIAEKESIKIYTPEKIRGNIDFINELKSLSCDLFIVIAYGKILPKEILEIPKFGCWNAHASLLPRWRGAAPIQWSLIKGDEFTGVGIMKMNEGLDTGDILLEEKIKINTLGREITYARMIEKSDFKVDWGNEAIKISQKIKGLYPRTNTNFRGKNLKILKIKVLTSDVIKNEKYLFMSNYSRPGIILAVIENEGIIISTKTDPIILLEAKLEGKNISSKKQLIQQLKPSAGEYLSD